MPECVRKRSAEEREHRVAQEAIDAAIVLHDRIDHGLEHVVHRGRRLLRGQPSRSADRAREVREQDGDDPILAFFWGQESFAQGVRQRLLESAESLGQGGDAG